MQKKLIKKNGIWFRRILTPPKGHAPICLNYCPKKYRVDSDILCKVCDLFPHAWEQKYQYVPLSNDF
jgi:hypothetical protein